MATHKNHEELKQQAIRNLAASREEISGKMQSLRSELNPKAVMHRVVDRHKVAVACVAVGAVAATSLLIYNRTHAGHGKPIHAPRPADRSADHGIISHLIRLLAGALVPALVRSMVVAPLANLHKHRDDEIRSL